MAHTISRMKLRFYVPVIALLLLQLFIRTHHITIQNPYIDEGFHIRRAGFIYDFDFHPARVSHGKLLLYFWLGLFETDRLHVLATSRLSIGLISLVTGAGLYQIGKTLHSRPVGLLALLLYTFCPIALFYERMAMADPLATVFATLTVWRGLVLAKRPTLKEGALLGGLVGLAVMAKLTMGLLPLLPVLATVIFYKSPSPLMGEGLGVRTKIDSWTKTYLPPLTAAALTTLLLWLPILIPAARALNTEEPFKLVNAYNLRSNAEEEKDQFTPLE
ncbi:MAG: glycosyltransferase family 39 protein, partial [Anaerolineae bacterium]|nr:glycosyltransferase family 39 protein [Anaerolineae bacterium]